MNSAYFWVHVSKTPVFTMNSACFLPKKKPKHIFVQKHQFLQWIMHSFSKTSVFTLKKSPFPNLLCWLLPASSRPAHRSQGQHAQGQHAQGQHAQGQHAQGQHKNVPPEDPTISLIKLSGAIQPPPIYMYFSPNSACTEGVLTSVLRKHNVMALLPVALLPVAAQ